MKKERVHRGFKVQGHRAGALSGARGGTIVPECFSRATVLGRVRAKAPRESRGTSEVAATLGASAECDRGNSVDAPWDRADVPYTRRHQTGRAVTRQASLLPLGMVLHQVGVQLLVVVESSLESL
ncbi:hypothetical protein PIB30_077620 [Stylosanthes scabra]|uniref:Uncharacterized protein n=1 Tax=Stylosanthes scabra TaxID=79078 RepID=A0ABU6XSR1_9FABA|nr:hypothetical protein [Stylosanthes scabra]